MKSMGSISRPVPGNDQVLAEEPFRQAERRLGGCLTLNADDWGQDVQTTNAIFDCSQRGVISSVSAMVFMEDSERAASMTLEHGIDTGLHLNLMTPFEAKHIPNRLKESQEEIAKHLHGNRFAQAIFHPGLVREFDYVVKAQLEEFQVLYGRSVARIDGHHHMHLCANVLLQRLLPPNTVVRRNFSFEAGEKSLWNRAYRGLIDRVLARHHRMADYFFSLLPLVPHRRLERIFSLAHTSLVEVETHPINSDEYCFLTGEGIARLIEHARFGPLAATCSGSEKILP